MKTHRASNAVRRDHEVLLLAVLLTYRVVLSLGRCFMSTWYSNIDRFRAARTRTKRRRMYHGASCSGILWRARLRPETGRQAGPLKVLSQKPTKAHRHRSRDQAQDALCRTTKAWPEPWAKGGRGTRPGSPNGFQAFVRSSWMWGTRISRKCKKCRWGRNEESLSRAASRKCIAHVHYGTSWTEQEGRCGHCWGDHVDQWSVKYPWAYVKGRIVCWRGGEGCMYVKITDNAVTLIPR